MANRVVKILAAVVVLAAMGAGAGWYVMSGQTVSHTQTLLASFNSKPATGGFSFKFTPEQIQRTPFPHIGVRLVNPKFEIALPMGADGKVQTIASSSQGTTDIITDYLGKQYRIENNAGGTIVTTIGEEKISQTLSPTSVKAVIAANSLSSFMAWNKLNAKDATAVKAAIKNIKTVSLTMSPFTMTDAATSKPIMAQEKMEFTATNRSTDAQLDFDMALDIKGSEISPEYYAMIDKFMPSKPSASPFGLKGDMPFSPARAGKQDMTIDLGFNAPMGTPGVMPTAGTVDLRKFALKNNFYTLNLPTKVVMKGARSAAVNLNWSLDATAAGAAEMQRMVDMGATFLGNPMMHGGAQAPSVAPEVKEKIIAALPTLSTLGPITLVLDMDATQAATTASPQGASVTLRNLAFNHKRWGLEAKGSGSVGAEGTKTDMTVVCKKCDYMTWDGVTAAMQAQVAAELIKPGSGAWGITAATMTSLNALLADIGKKDAAGDITFVVTTPGANDIRINDKPFAEAMMKAMVAFAPPPAAPVEVAPAAGAPTKKAAKK